MIIFGISKDAVLGGNEINSYSDDDKQLALELFGMRNKENPLSEVEVQVPRAPVDLASGSQAWVYM